MLNSMSTVVYNNHYIVSESVVALMVLVYFMLAIVGFMTVVVSFIANWKLFEKMGYKGWQGIIPFYSEYILVKELYGSGWYFLLLLIPIVNIYYACGLMNRLGKRFHKSLRWRIVLLMVFGVYGEWILAFSDDVYDKSVKF